MNTAIYFKALQRKSGYRNPKHRLGVPDANEFSILELIAAQKYVEGLDQKNILFTFPGDFFYPNSFYRMKEPPLFLEYEGTPCWTTTPLISVVGSRKCHALTTQWIDSELTGFLHDNEGVGVVSGGAYGVDLKSHYAAIKAKRSTVVVLPCGLNELYPNELEHIRDDVRLNNGALLTEFECDQQVRRASFYFRNRLIANLGDVCLVAQAGIKSGTMLTVHHALENGRPVVTLPGHPMLTDFLGNIKLMSEGASYVTDRQGLTEFWRAERWSSPRTRKIDSNSGG